MDYSVTYPTIYFGSVTLYFGNPSCDTVLVIRGYSDIPSDTHASIVNRRAKQQVMAKINEQGYFLHLQQDTFRLFYPAVHGQAFVFS